ncbi:aspartic protease [Aphelenchoides avenae]|nr:aspartic protease [Aphelenchus avenae]
MNPTLFLFCVSIFLGTHADDAGILQQDLISYRDSHYGALFQVGTPPQKVYLNVVVGRAITTNPKIKVASPKCAECNFGLTFNSTASTTFKMDRSIESEKEKADRGRDTLTVPGSGGKTVQLESQPLDVVTSEGEANAFTLQPFDGIIDFSLDANNAVGAMAKAGLIQAPVYTIYMKRTCSSNYVGLPRSSGTPMVGTLTYGAVDSTNCKPTPNYVTVTQVTDTKLNTIQVDSASVGSALSPLTWKARVTATGPMFVPTKVFNALASAWNATKARLMDEGYVQWIVNCDKKFDPLVLTIGLQKYTIPDYAYVRQVGDECHLAIIDVGGDDFANGGYLSLGLPFSYQHCIVFDIANSKIGFAEHANQPQTALCKYDAIYPKSTFATTTPSSADRAAMHLLVASFFALWLL